MEPLLNVKQASAILGIDPHTLYQWISEHKIPFIKIGRLVKFKASMLEDWIQKRIVTKKPFNVDKI